MQISGPLSTSSDAGVADASNTESGSMINALTEDAVNAACLGFNHQSQQSKNSHGADDDQFAVLILNIEDAQSSDWSFSVASGSWKRVCINLVSNALKYTPSGYINVTLRKSLLQQKPGKERSALIELVVSWAFI
jgi:signal transduction histidine kinase